MPYRPERPASRPVDSAIICSRCEGNLPVAGEIPLALYDTIHLLHEHLWPQFAHFDNFVCWDVQPLRRLANGLGIRSLIQAVSLLLVSAQEREQPLDADIGVDLGDL